MHEQRQASQIGAGGATGVAPVPVELPPGWASKGLDMLTHPQLQRFLAGALLGLVGGLAFLVAMALLPAVFGLYPLVVVSGSMEPTIHVGDIAVVRKQDPYRFKIGDVVTYSTAGGNITHRIVGMDITPQGPFFLLRGDANLTADPRAIPAQAIVGKVVYRVPRLGFLVSFVNSTAGRVLFIATPLLLLVFLWVRRTIRRRGPPIFTGRPLFNWPHKSRKWGFQRKANTK